MYIGASTNMQHVRSVLPATIPYPLFSNYFSFIAYSAGGSAGASAGASAGGASPSAGAASSAGGAAGAMASRNVFMESNSAASSRPEGGVTGGGWLQVWQRWASEGREGR